MDGSTPVISNRAPPSVLSLVYPTPVIPNIASEGFTVSQVSVGRFQGASMLSSGTLVVNGGRECQNRHTNGREVYSPSPKVTNLPVISSLHGRSVT